MKEIVTFLKHLGKDDFRKSMEDAPTYHKDEWLRVVDDESGHRTFEQTGKLIMKADGETPQECHILTELADLLRAVASKIDVNNEEVEAVRYEWDTEVTKWEKFMELKTAWEIEEKKQGMKNLLASF